MRIYNFVDLKVISASDIIKVLSHRVPFSFKELTDSERQKMSLFKESVDVLGITENFVSDIKTGTAPTRDEYDQAIESRNQIEIKRICAYFSKLRHHEKLMPDSYFVLSESFRVFRQSYSMTEFLQGFNIFACHDPFNLTAEQSEIELINKMNANAFNLKGDASKLRYDWTVDFRMVADIRKELEENNTRSQEKNTQCLKLIKAAYKDFDELLDQHTSVRSLSLDIRLINDYRHRDLKNHHDFIKKSLLDIQIVKDGIKRLPFLLSVSLKVESDYQLGINFHTVLIFKNQPNLNEDKIIQDLHSELRYGFNGRQNFEIINWNDVVRVHFSKSAVGVIKKSNLKKIEDFKYWNLSYFFCVDDYLKFEYFDDKDCEVPVNYFFKGRGIDKVGFVSSLKEIVPTMYFRSLLLDKDEKQIWTVTHLPKIIRYRLGIAKLHYNEIVSQDQNLTKLMLLLFQIEVFIESILHASVLAFDIPHQRAIDYSSEKQLANFTTRIGMQFLSLCRQGHQLIPLIENIETFSYLNIYIKSYLFGPLCSICIESDEILDKFIDERIMRQVNSAIRDFISIYNSKINEISFCSNLLKIVAGEKSLEEYLKYKYSSCKVRQSSAISYVGNLLKKDCVLYRVNLSCIVLERRLTQGEFSKLFTMFIRFGKRAKPLSWMYGYIGIWQEDALHNPFADVVFFLDAQAYDHHDNFIQQLNEYWTKFISKKIEFFIKTSKENIIGLAMPVKLLSSVSEINQSYLLIESIDKTKRKIIMNKLIPYFTYKDLFQGELTEKIPKAFFKGSLPKKLTKSKKSKSLVSKEIL